MKITKEHLKQVVKEEISSVLEEETAGTRKASEQEIKTLIDNSKDIRQFEPGSDVQTSFVEDALNITIIGRFRNEIYVQPGKNRGYHSGKSIYILGKLL
jgi:hypothetical protein